MPPDVGCEELQRARQRAMRGPSRQTTIRLGRPARRLAGGDSTREVSDSQAFGAIGNIGERQRTARSQQFGR